MPLQPGTRLGVYEILGPLGAGGTGEVWRARDTGLGRDVATKQLGPALAPDPGYLVRLEREAQTLAALNHPNIAAIYGLEEGAIVTELVPGDTLADPPDGRYPGYQSNESGHYELYVRTFPDASVSRGRAGQPRWSRDGRKILFLNGGRTVTELDVQLRPTFQAAGSYSGVPGCFYEYAPALAPGRLIAILNADNNVPVTVVENWRAKLGR